jgi:hypothetical protein
MSETKTKVSLSQIIALYDCTIVPSLPFNPTDYITVL